MSEIHKADSLTFTSILTFSSIICFFVYVHLVTAEEVVSDMLFLVCIAVRVLILRIMVLTCYILPGGLSKKIETGNSHKVVHATHKQ